MKFSSSPIAFLLTLLLGCSLPVGAQSEENDTAKAASLGPDSIALYAPLEDDPLLAQMDSLWMQMGMPFKNSAGNTSTDSLAVLPEKSEVERRMQLLDLETPFDLVYNGDVQRFIDLYTQRRQAQMNRMLGEAAYYFPMFEESLEAYGLPLELKYLAVVESALNPRALSRVRAQGLWQFMLPTGKLYGLKVNNYVDDRCDPRASTDAACRYLRDLHELFGDWSLALAAYNSGPGNVRKAIRRSGGKKEYWAIRKFLPRETRSYVPAFIAVNYAFQYAADYGLKAEPPLFSYHQVDTLLLDAPVYFDQIAALLATDVQILQKLNPQYIMDYVPAAPDASARRTLVLPANKVGLFISHRDSIRKLIALEAERKEQLGRSAEPVVEHITHRVRSGESLGLIAQRYGVRVSQIKEWNKLSGHLIRTGQKLIIYSSVDHGSRKKKTASVTVTSDANTDVYTVRPGDTLYGIAQRYPGISPEQIMEWNRIRSARKIKPGMKLRIHKKS
jgi:membrane-bound lytic murein transglycosylase D